MAKGQYMLQTDHYFPGDNYLQTGTVVGDGTPWPVEGPPSMNMSPLDGTAQDEIGRYLKDKNRPDIPLPPINPTGANLAPGPGQVVQTTLGSGPPRGHSGSVYDSGAPMVRGTALPRLTPTEQKIADERVAMEEEDREAAADAATNAALARAKAAAVGASMIPAEELARKAEAEKKAAADAEADKKAAAAKAVTKPSTPAKPS